MRLIMVGSGQTETGRAEAGRAQFRQQDSGSRYGAGRKSPLGLGGTVAVHAVVIGAFLLIPKEAIDIFTPSPPIETVNIPLPKPPDPVIDDKTDARVQTRQPPRDRPTVTDPLTDLPKGDPPLTRTEGSGAGTGPTPPYVPPPPPIAEPVLTEPQIDPRALPAFQPDYPGAMIRQGLEGKVTVRVLIDADGRVSGIEKIAATDERFWLATQRHALRTWRFRPATRDGVPVASSKTLTVRFTLTER
ncbi:TonB family protein [Sphingobium sp. HBC34]|uniref:TonB family protein n=1 Tax=Sphingobium cyanobacteriorum TaxID=3063954 RepID=A0ABT8ZMY0_9SPHN|nr:energy transducer TonB [Sphingobium sp. HBC34]MDO7835902.1 TonB family protein [Sphingobium sp. HBC34]